MTTKEQFIEMAKGITRPGIDQMMAWLETTDFYTAPASTRFHGAEEGGLCAHYGNRNAVVHGRIRCGE